MPSKRCWRLVASPPLVESLGAPEVPADLHRYPALDMEVASGVHAWALDGPQGAHVTVNVAPRLVTDDMIALRAAAVRGVGVTQLPGLIVDDAIRDGALVELLPDWSPKTGLVHAAFATRRGLLPSVRALIDYLVERLAE